MENKPLVYGKISEVMEAVEAISKDRKNTVQGYSFRGIDDMYNALNEHLAKAKIFFTSEVVAKEREERATKSGGNLIYTVLTIKWRIYAEDGSFVETATVGEAMDSGDKSANKAMSAAYKYALMQVFCIPTDEPKDTENETHEVAPKTTTLTDGKMEHVNNVAATGSADARCADCGGPMSKGVSKKTGRPFCAAKCWLNADMKVEQPITLEELNNLIQ